MFWGYGTYASEAYGNSGPETKMVSGASRFALPNSPPVYCDFYWYRGLMVPVAGMFSRSQMRVHRYSAGLGTSGCSALGRRWNRSCGYPRLECSHLCLCPEICGKRRVRGSKCSQPLITGELPVIIGNGPGAAMIIPHGRALNWSKEQNDANRRDGFGRPGRRSVRGVAKRPRC